MKNFFTKFSTAVFALLLLALCNIFVSASPPTIQPNMEKSNVKILIIGLPSSGVVSAVAERLAERGIEAVFIAESSGGDALTVNAVELPPIINKRDILPVATVGRFEPDIHLKTETRESVSKFTANEFYKVPPNDYGFSGQSFANPIRARPQND